MLARMVSGSKSSVLPRGWEGGEDVESDTSLPRTLTGNDELVVELGFLQVILGQLVEYDVQRTGQDIECSRLLLVLLDAVRGQKDDVTGRRPELDRLVERRLVSYAATSGLQSRVVHHFEPIPCPNALVGGDGYRVA